MPTKTQLEVLEEILRRGPWESRSHLMAECLDNYPHHFDILTTVDANRVIDYGNQCLGHLAVFYMKERDIAPHLFPQGQAEGRCVDMWQEDDAPEIPSLFDEIDDITEERSGYWNSISDSVAAVSTGEVLTTDAGEVMVGPSGEVMTYNDVESSITFQAPPISGVQYVDRSVQLNVQVDDTGQTMTESDEILRLREELAKSKQELEDTIKDDEKLQKAFKKMKKFAGRQLANKIATERTTRSKSDIYKQAYGAAESFQLFGGSVRTGRTLYKKRK